MSNPQSPLAAGDRRSTGAPVSGELAAESQRLSTGLAISAELAAEAVETARETPVVTPLRKGYLALLVISYFAVYVAWIAPTAFSLAIRVDQIDPAGRNSAIALAVGIPSLIVLVTGPLVGVASDRTRLRLGRRRTWMLAGMVTGLIGSVLVGLAATIPLLIAAWTVAFIGYTATGAMFVTHLGDRVPQEQQGRVAGFTGAVTQVAPVVGVALAGAFAQDPVAMFAAPAAVAFVLGLVFVIAMKDGPAPADVPKVSAATVLQGYWFNPRRHPDFAWVWLSRCLIFLALSFMSLYTVFLLGERLAFDSAAIAGLVATVGGLGLIAAIIGALGSGVLSDRLKRRKPFIVLGALLLAAGLLTVATVQSVPQFIVGTLVAVFGVGIFGAIDQAIGLDTLPKDQGQNGRFIGIFNLANQLAQGVGPFLAAGIVALGAGNYTWVYVVAAALAVAGGLLILPVRPDRPRTVEPARR